MSKKRKETETCTVLNEMPMERHGSIRTSCCNNDTNIFDIKQQVLRKIIVTTIPLTALSLSKFLDVQKTLINSALYELAQRGDIQKGHETPPQWTYNRSNHKVNENKENIWNLLMRKGCMSSHSIAWELNENMKTVNRILYELEKDQKLERVQLSPPIWKVRNNQSNSVNTNSVISSKQMIAKHIDSRESHCTTQSKKLKSIHRVSHVMVNKELSRDVAGAVWKAYEHHCEDTLQKDVILAGFVMREKFPDTKKKDTYTVIALGTGTKSVAGDKYSLEGTVVHDCHAEIVARRSLIRWIYRQISNAGKLHSFAVKTGKGSNTPYKLLPFELWLYCSQTPCGDAAVFSRSDPQPANVPCFTTTKHGVFRLKPEAGLPGLPAHVNEVEQSFDRWQLGHKSYCHTCSDKLAKWSVVGVQGALLAQLIPPLYTNGIVISEVFAEGHATRAICCRSDKALEKNPISIHSPTSPYALHHPKIGHWPLQQSRIKQSRTTKNNLSMNWALGDKHTEVLNATTGRTNGKYLFSRISKKALFRSFQSLQTISPEATYKEIKSQAEAYHSVQGSWKKAMISLYGGKWAQKPSEVDDFTLKGDNSNKNNVFEYGSNSSL